MAGLALAFAGLATASCQRPYPRGDIVVSIIGPELDMAARRADIPTAPELALRGATGLGLLRLDEAAQLMPGVAARWAMIDEGPDGIFRIDLANGLSTREIAARMAAAITAPANRWIGRDIREIVPVTPTVIDLRLAEPRSELLTILAMPALATVDRDGGPMQIVERTRGAVRLEARSRAGEGNAPGVLLRGERAGRAVARFVVGEARLVSGGTFADLPVARAAALPRGALRFDHPAGLFGLVPADIRSAYAAPRMIEALSLAIDRDRIAGAFGASGYGKTTTLAGSRYEAPLPDRRARARATIGIRRSPLPALRVRMPPGPGARLLFQLLAQDWQRVGIEAIPIEASAPADLLLVDVVVPPGERARLACVSAAGCDAGDKRALLDPPYIPIGTPIRWSLVAPELDLFTENALSVHPLDRLRSAR